MTKLQRSRQPFLHIGSTGGGESITLTGSDFERHKWIMGITGSGKSTFLVWIALSLLRLGIAFCVIDPHGDLARLILSLLAPSDFFKTEKAQKLWFIDFNRTDATIPFNVLKQPHLDNYKVANNLLTAIHRAFPTTTGTTASLDNTITYAAFVLAENGMPVTALQQFLLDSSFRETLLKRVTDPQIRQFFDFKFADKVSSQLIDSTMRRLDLLTFSPSLRAALGQTENRLNFRALMDNQISCIFSLGGLDDQSKRLLGSLLMVNIEQAFLSRATIAPANRYPWHVIIDEFPLFSASGDSFSVILEQVRKYKGTLYLAHQTLSQLQKGTMGSLQNAIPILMKAGSDDSSALVSRFYRPAQEEPGFFDLLFGNRAPSSPFTKVKNTTEARQIFETLERQEALVSIHHEIKKIITPTLPIQQDTRALQKIEDMYASRLLVPISQTLVEPSKPDLVVLHPPVSPVSRRVRVPASETKEPLTLVTGILDSDIMLSLFHFHYMTLVQIATLLQKEKSSNYVREKIHTFIADGLIDKISLPRSSPGKSPTVYFLTTKGQKKITDTFSLSMPLSAAARKHQFLEHTLSVNDVFLAGVKLPTIVPSLTLVDLKHERTLKASPLILALGRAVVPDGFLEYQTASSELIGLCLEIDRNTESPEKIQEKAHQYTKALTSGAYSKAFGIHSCTIAFCITVGGDRRREHVRTWVKEVVEHSPLQELCLFAAVSDFSTTLFTDPVFRGVDNSPHGLIEKPM